MFEKEKLFENINMESIHSKSKNFKCLFLWAHWLFCELAAISAHVLHPGAKSTQPLASWCSTSSRKAAPAAKREERQWPKKPLGGSRKEHVWCQSQRIFGPERNKRAGIFSGGQEAGWEQGWGPDEVLADFPTLPRRKLAVTAGHQEAPGHLLGEP